MEYLPLEVISHIFTFLPTIDDRKAASLVCKLWHEAYQSPSVKRMELLVIGSNEVFDELIVLRNHNRFYPNVSVRGVNITRNMRPFWRRYGPYIKSLSFSSCDIREKVFVKLILHCDELEYLSIQDCRELFMSGLLFESEEERALVKSALSHVRTLGLGYNRYLSDSLFARFTSVCPNVRELLLPGCYISFHSGLYNRFYQNGHSDPSECVLTFSVIYDYIKDNAAKLKVLSFAETLIDSEALCSVARISNLRLKKLHIRGCVQVSNESVIALAELQNCLTHLDVGLCPRVTDQALTTICARLPGLKSLSVQGCRQITDTGASELWKLTEIVELNISECERINDEGILKGLGARVNKTMRKLYMSHLAYISDKSITEIMECLPNLIVLDLGYCFKAVTDRSVQSIFYHAKKLKRLVLTMCDGLTDRGITGIALQLPPAAESRESRLRHFMKSREEMAAARNDSGQRLIEDILKNISPNSDLRGTCIRHLKNLENLTLSGCNRVSDLSLKFGFKLNNLKTLDFSTCQHITSEGLAYISQYNKSLEVLNLDNCHNIDDEGVGHVLKSLKRLKSLTLGSNKITNRILEFLGQKTSNLSFLDVRHCPQLSAATVNKIIAYYPRLQVVHFSTKANDFQYMAPHPHGLPFNHF